MDQNFQTSFIPKKPIVEQTATNTADSKPVGFLLVIGIVIFLAMIAVSAGVYIYKGNLVKQKIQMEESIRKAKGRFEPSQITKYKLLDKKLHASSQVLSKHIVVSPIFEALQAVTMKSVRYTNFSYTFSGSSVVVTLSGQAVGYQNIALQSDLFKKNKNLIDPVFSGITLGEKDSVSFNLTFSVDPSFVDYKKVIEKGSEGIIN
jgi:hypothetical protein